jgi:hypothetical protein
MKKGDNYWIIIGIDIYFQYVSILNGCENNTSQCRIRRDYLHGVTKRIY